MQWELVATWLGLAITVLGFAFKMGKQTQKIEEQSRDIDTLKAELEKTREMPIKMASLETDMRHVLTAVTEIKVLLMRDRS
jgi:Tfp pilus assembly protein PilO